MSSVLVLVKQHAVYRGIGAVSRCGIYAFKAGAVSKGAASYFGNAARNGDALKARAVKERAKTNAFQAAGEGNAFKSSAV